MDALAVSIATSLTLKPFKMRYALLMGAYFGFFQFLMPLVGCFLGSTVSESVEAFGCYISFGLLAFIGIKMILDSLKPGAEGAGGMKTISHKQLFLMAVATSIDALAVGVSFVFMEVRIIPSCLLIGAVTFLVVLAGSVLGSRFTGISAGKAGVVGGLVLLGIGVKLLIEGIIL